MERVQLGLRHVDLAEGVFRLLHFVSVAHLAVGHAGRPHHVVDVVDFLEHHADALDAVGELDRDRRQVDAAGLLEVGELRNLLAVVEHLPADAPGAERRRLPVVLFETHVVRPQVDAAGLEALEIQRLHIVGRRLQDDLELLMLEEAVGVLAEAPVGRPPRRLHVRDIPRRRPEHAQEGLG